MSYEYRLKNIFAISKILAKIGGDLEVMATHQRIDKAIMTDAILRIENSLANLREQQNE